MLIEPGWAYRRFDKYPVVADNGMDEALCCEIVKDSVFESFESIGTSGTNFADTVLGLFGSRQGLRFASVVCGRDKLRDSCKDLGDSFCKLVIFSALFCFTV